MNNYKPVTHVIFDMDGLLLDTENLYTIATQEVVSQYGKVYTWEIKSKVMGFVGTEVAAAIVQALELPISPDEYLDMAQSVVHRMFPSCKILPDTEHLYTLTTNKIANQYGKTYTWEIKTRLMGLMGREAAVAITAALDLPMTPEEYMTESQEIMSQLFSDCTVLPDTEDLYTRATQEVADEFGRTFTWDLKVRQMGLPSMELARLIVGELALPMTEEQYLERVSHIHRQLFPTASLMPGVERLVRHLHAKGVPIAVATSSSRENYDLKTQRHAHLFDLFHHVVTGSSDPEVTRGKPAPDIFLICANRFPQPPPLPANCLVFEDAPNGVKASCAAGMQTVMIPDSRMDPEMTKEATLVLPSMELFRPELFGLPAFD